MHTQHVYMAKVRQDRFDAKANVVFAAVAFSGFAYTFCQWWFQW